jgi:hypothetical protein
MLRTGNPDHDSQTCARRVPRRSSTARSGVRRARLSRAVLLAALGLVPVVALSGYLLDRQSSQRRVRQLHAADPQLRRAAAWALAERPDRRGELELARRLDLESETDADVREAMVHTLGQLGNPQHFGPVIRAAEFDESGFVRQAAWLSAALLDAVRFRDFIADRPPARDAWDRVGLAQARLAVGDVSAVSDLLELAADGPPEPRALAMRAIERQLAPLLELAGRWPLDAPDRASGEWPVKFLIELRRRCQELDLAALSARIRQLDHEARRLRRDIGRVIGGRERLVRLLFGR